MVVVAVNARDVLSHYPALMNTGDNVPVTRV